MLVNAIKRMLIDKSIKWLSNDEAETNRERDT
jgi:hypothetical protein